jgi:hypothetical protein
MKVTNIHRRIITESKPKLATLFETLATNNDAIWPYEKWPAIRFKDGVKIGAKGGHGPIKYSIEEYSQGELIRFRFSKPQGFNGFHELYLNEISNKETEIVHVIKMVTTISASLQWLFVIRWLHDALIEDAFDKVENHFLENKKRSKHNFWVKMLRKKYKKK